MQSRPPERLLYISYLGGKQLFGSLLFIGSIVCVFRLCWKRFPLSPVSCCFKFKDEVSVLVIN